MCSQRYSGLKIASNISQQGSRSLGTTHFARRAHLRNLLVQVFYGTASGLHVNSQTLY